MTHFPAFDAHGEDTAFTLGRKVSVAPKVEAQEAEARGRDQAQEEGVEGEGDRARHRGAGRLIIAI